MTASVISLHPDWVWKPTWCWTFDPVTGAASKVWTGEEYLHTIYGEQVITLFRGGGWGVGSGGAVSRRAPPPDRDPPTKAEGEANYQATMARRRARDEVRR